MITSHQTELVKASFDSVRPIAGDAGVMLYERIFSIAPETRGLFKDDIRPQAARLMAAVEIAVDKLDNLHELAPFLIKLGARHWDYGVRPKHLNVGGEALLWTLEQGLGDTFNPELRDAWMAAWNVIADAIVTGLNSAALRDSDAPLARAPEHPTMLIPTAHP